MVVLGASPLKNGALFPAKNSADFSGRASKVKVVLRESGHVDRALSGTVCSWSSPVNALTAEVRRGNGNTGLAAPRKWVSFHGSLRFGCGFLRPYKTLRFKRKSNFDTTNGIAYT